MKSQVQQDISKEKERESTLDEEIKEFDRKISLEYEVYKDFMPLAEKYRSFYATIYLNKINRKVTFKVCNGKFKCSDSEKIDPEDK